jgi:hypothetical protein
LAIIALRARFTHKWRSHLNSAGQSKTVLFYNCLGNQLLSISARFPFSSKCGSYQQQGRTWHKVDALNETKAICLLPSEIDLKETHKVKSLSTLKKN